MVDKWNPEDDTRKWGEKEEDRGRERRGERREKEEMEREPHDFKPEYLGWSMTSDRRKAVNVCEETQDGGAWLS